MTTLARQVVSLMQMTLGAPEEMTSTTAARVVPRFEARPSMTPPTETPKMRLATMIAPVMNKTPVVVVSLMNVRAVMRPWVPHLPTPNLVAQTAAPTN